ncbi:MAG: hypothetical protein GC146_03920 [Limimaricola sp.]|uniref:hypothetical protein n=1 Tax=Limimaricola sp. TaxID=2211665 RepID=UPI001E127AB1|nr:hypothetical protein [Limimaricola sp.]MBI1416348.1 hypothetical protein [Limimaricola sp.]
MAKHAWILAAVAVLGLSGCLENDMQRGLVGAAGGAVAANAVGVNPVTGAVVGGAIGATCDQYSSVCR